MANKSIDKNQEILLPPEGSGELLSPLPSINADLKEIAKKPVNGLLSGLSSPEEAPLRDSIKKKEKKKVKVVLKPAKTENKRTTGVRKTKISKSEKVDKDQVKKEQPPPPASPTEVKTEIKKEAKDDIEIETNQDPVVTKPKTPMTSPKLPLNGKVKTEDEDDDDEIEDQKSPESPSKNGPNACPKGKYCLFFLNR